MWANEFESDATNADDRGVTLVSKVGGTKIVLARTIEGPKVPSEARSAEGGWGLGGAP